MRISSRIVACLLQGIVALYSIVHAGDASNQLVLGGTNATVRQESSLQQVKWDVNAVTETTQKYDIVSMPEFADHQLRITKRKSKLCDESVKQQSGYIDISDGRHLFFWFFEARNDPENAPLMLWINGGPGCSSISSGLLFENGPCFIADGGNRTEHNPHSWNEHLNIIYLDEPIGTGYSYSSDGSSVKTLVDLAVDVYAFLTLFLTNYPQYASAPFHIAAESWGGHFGPHIASYIHDQNQQAINYPREGMMHINLASLILANGLTEPYSQFESIPEYLCGGAPYPFFEPDSIACRSLRANRALCLPLIKVCYRFKTKVPCGAATAHCWPTMMIQGTHAGTNPYDIRKTCGQGSEACYSEIDDAGRWMNRTDVKQALGAEADSNFRVCNMDVNLDFYAQGQAFHNSAELLPRLLYNGVRLLVYAGNTDSVCNYQGIELWMTRLQNKYQTEFTAAPSLPWRTSASGYLAGEVRTAGRTNSSVGNYTFVQIYEAGHMAPHDQPEAALDMIEKWVHDRAW